MESALHDLHTWLYSLALYNLAWTQLHAPCNITDRPALEWHMTCNRHMVTLAGLLNLISAATTALHPQLLLKLAMYAFLSLVAVQCANVSPSVGPAPCPASSTLPGFLHRHGAMVPAPCLVSCTLPSFVHPA